MSQIHAKCLPEGGNGLLVTRDGNNLHWEEYALGTFSRLERPKGPTKNTKSWQKAKDCVALSS
jgi:hypothetical protein